MSHSAFLLSAYLMSGVVAASVALADSSAGADESGTSGYHKAPPSIANILEAPAAPTVLMSPDQRTLAILEPEGLPSIAQLSRPTVRLAGYRVDASSNGPAEDRARWLRKLTLRDVSSGKETDVALPAGMRFGAPVWSPDGRHLAFVASEADQLRLWLVDTMGKTTSLVGGVNGAFGIATDARLRWSPCFAWLPDSRSVIVRQVSPARAAPPSGPSHPTAPMILENIGRVAPARSNEDLLRNPADEAQFEYYFSSVLAEVTLDGKVRQLGAPALITQFSVSPDGRHLLVEKLTRPYAYTLPAWFFPTQVAVLDLAGTQQRLIQDRPLADQVPVTFDAVVTGPRNVQWRSDAAATVFWVEALDGGDPQREVPKRDRLLMLAAPFRGEPQLLADLEQRFFAIYWSDDGLALAIDRQWRSRTERRYTLAPARRNSLRLYAQRNYQDVYDDPGLPLTTTNASGKAIMERSRDGRAIFLSGEGASRQGAFPFLSTQNFAAGKVNRIWSAQPPYYERAVALLDEGRRILTLRESAAEAPNYYLRDLRSGKIEAVTRYADPAPSFAAVARSTISYDRDDGLRLSGTLYLPANYQPGRDAPLPTLLWAYPYEFTDASVAAQVVDQGNRFSRPSGISALFFVTQGYAVLLNPSMPIVGQQGAQPNDTYLEQLTASARAAVRHLTSLGVSDPKRIAVGGHSYGAFMTANLLAHTDLFRAGIALSGAYNRTLTPFGFQSEERNYWQAMQSYNRMSPFMFADRINEPLLLVHGAADDNVGTYPIQSERMYAALKALGATARYVSLPNEPHGYRAMESTQHVLWEMSRWLDIQVKNAR